MAGPVKKLVVIGGGAAGFFCAVNAARLNPLLKVTILEKSGKLLSKVRISGGGRCNVTHACFDISEMSNRYPRGKNFIKKTFHHFFTTDTIKWFEERGVILKAEEDGRMFPVTDSSQTIIHCLLKEANEYGVQISLNTEVTELTFHDQKFHIKTNKGDGEQADFVCVAAGGYAKPAMFHWLEKLGHTFSSPVPSLFTFNLPKHPISSLMGVSVENVRIKIEGSKLSEEGPLLITHWGLSGPAVLKLSAWGARELFEKNYSFKVHINWVADHTEIELRSALQQLRVTDPGKKVINIRITEIPGRLWQFLLASSGVDDSMKMGELPAKVLNAIIRNLVDYVAEVKGKTTFKEEFVTSGGIVTGEIDPNSMMSKKTAGLFFAGEVLDIDGITGGYNFQHAWTSGYIAAKTIAGG